MDQEMPIQNEYLPADKQDIDDIHIEEDDGVEIKIIKLKESIKNKSDEELTSDFLNNLKERVEDGKNRKANK